MSLTARQGLLLGVVTVAGAVTLVPATAGLGSSAEDGTGRIVLVSGRDDHGLPALAAVPLQTAPEGARTASAVPDGSLAEVTSTHGEWLQVRTLEGAPRQGWVNDYYVRGTVHLVGRAPSCRVRLGGHDHPAGQQATVEAVRPYRVLVRALHDGSEGWVPRSHLQELPPSAVDGCAPAPVDTPLHRH